MTPVVVVDEHVLQEHKDFTLTKNEDRSVDLWLPHHKLLIKIRPPYESGIMLVGPKKDWPTFDFNGRPVLPVSVFSHIKGNFPGVSIRFPVGHAIYLLQLIPRLMDKKTERELELKEYEYHLTHGGFGEEYIEKYFHENPKTPTT